MKKDNTHEEPDALDEMREWTDEDWSKAKPNRFASAFDRGVTVVALDSDVAEVFTTADAVNKALRALIDAMPSTLPAKRRTKASSGCPVVPATAHER